MTDLSASKAKNALDDRDKNFAQFLNMPLQEAQELISKKSPQEKLLWAYERFGSKFAITTSFGIQSAVLLDMLQKIRGGNKVPIIWIDTGYLPKETYCYAAELTKKLKLTLTTEQSHISPARMEALYGKLWETKVAEDLEKYHQIRKVEPLENSLKKLEIICWASGVRSNQTDHRRKMSCLDIIRDRLSLRPLLDWNQKDIFYYMQENNLPQHPLFNKGYSTVGDWHSSAPDGFDSEGRATRFGGLKQECGIHLPGFIGDGI